MSSFDKLTLAEQAQCSLIAMEAVEACGVSKRYHYMQYERVKMKEAECIVASKPKPPLSVVAGANAFFGDGFRVGDIKSSTKTTHTHHDAPDLVEAAEGRHLFSTPEANPEVSRKLTVSRKPSRTPSRKPSRPKKVYWAPEVETVVKVNRRRSECHTWNDRIVKTTTLETAKEIGGQLFTENASLRHTVYRLYKLNGRMESTEDRLRLERDGSRKQ